MKGHYLPLATIAWGISLYFLFGNLELLGGHTGHHRHPGARRSFGLELRNERHFYYLIWAIALAALWATQQPARLAAGPRDPRAARADSRWPRRSASTRARLKIVVFVYAALLACISGWLYAHLQRFVNPTPFGINQGIEYLFMAVVGGAGSVWGAVVGATLITLLKQVLQDVLPRAARPQRQLRDRRVRHPDGPAAAARARRRLAVDRAPAAAARAAAGARRAEPLPARDRTQPSTAPLLEVRAARKQFGGLVAVNDLSFDDPARRDPRADRPERRRQEHDVQPDLGRAAAHRRATSCSAASRSAAARRTRSRARGIGRTFQHVKLIAADERARQRRAGRLPARPRRRRRARRCSSTARRRRARAPRPRARSRASGSPRTLHDAAGSLPLGKQRIVEIARALAADPALLLLDEPAAGLRYLEKQELAALLRAAEGARA